MLPFVDKNYEKKQYLEIQQIFCQKVAKITF